MSADNLTADQKLDDLGDGNSDAVKEREAIWELLRAAHKYGLDADVVHAFGVARASGSDVYEAVAFAYREWDL